MTGSIAETAKITGKKQAEKNFQTQWLAQFLVAAELTRRGYTVTLSLGNCPVIDLMVRVPGTNASFVVDVKGTSNKYSGWWMSRKEQSLDCCAMFSFMPPRSAHWMSLFAYSGRGECAL
jgi:hypothetical protein